MHPDKVAQHLDTTEGSSWAGFRFCEFDDTMRTFLVSVVFSSLLALGTYNSTVWTSFNYK